MSDDWKEHRLYVTETLKSLDNKMDTVLQEQASIKLDLATHKIKSGFWGAFMGAFVALVSKLWGAHS